MSSSLGNILIDLVTFPKSSSKWVAKCLPDLWSMEVKGVWYFWPNGKIFHQPGFPWNKGVPFHPFPFQKATFWGEGPLWGRSNLTRYLGCDLLGTLTGWESTARCQQDVRGSLYPLNRLDSLKMKGKNRWILQMRSAAQIYCICLV